MTILTIWVLFVGVVNYTVILGYNPIQPVARDNIIIKVIEYKSDVFRPRIRVCFPYITDTLPSKRHYDYVIPFKVLVVKH